MSWLGYMLFIITAPLWAIIAVLTFAFFWGTALAQQIIEEM